ncbi:MAG: nickel ABC transporter permease [Chloroflexota bacterium]
MGRYVVRRLLQAVIVLLGVSFLTFGIMFLAGDPAAVMVGEDWTDEQVEDFRQAMGFDQPWYVQYGRFLERAVQGDLGDSLRQNRPNLTLIVNRIPATVELALSALAISVLLAIPTGIISATRRNSWLDNVFTLFALLGQSLPTFWLGILLILIFSVTLRWTPVSGRDGLDHLILPALTLGAYSTARNARMMRSSMLEVLNQGYVQTARAKGLREFTVVGRHALRNALIPVITLIGLEFGALLGGAVITETIFAWPGVGRMTIQAIYGRDIPLVQASVMVLSAIFVLVNLVVDIGYTLLDPRVRLN